MANIVCAPILNNITVGAGESHDIILRFKNDPVLTNCTLTFTLRSNNNHDEIKLKSVQDLIGDVVIFKLSSDDTFTRLGEGLYYYDIWFNDNQGNLKVVTYGTIKIVRYTNRTVLA